MSDLLIQAMSAKQSGDFSLAKQLLSQAIVQNSRNEAAWMLLAEVVDDVSQRRNCLERVLDINPDNSAAMQELNKLNTSPLATILKGERNKPTETPKTEKTPPFTPPFTWDSQPEQYLALGDLTFPELTGEEANPLPETPPTFDWALESNEPDKTIDKIFEAVSKPELASEPPPEKDTSWLDELRPNDEIVETPAQERKAEERKVEERKVEDPWLNELVGSEAEITQEQPTLTEDDFSVSAEPELGLRAFTTDEALPIAPAEPVSLMWDNPHARSDRLVILSYRSLIYAHPSESDIPHILGLFNENRMVRDLLGESAHIIKLESIERVTANPKSASLVIEYKPNGKLITHQLNFSNPEVRNEALTALKFRLGAGFKQTSHTITMEDKILTPIVLIVLVAIVLGALLWGVPALSSLPGFDIGSPQLVLSSIQQFVDQIGAVIFIVVGVLIIGGCVAWMMLNLRKPASEVILHR